MMLFDVFNIATMVFMQKIPFEICLFISHILYYKKTAVSSFVYLINLLERMKILGMGVCEFSYHRI